MKSHTVYIETDNEALLAAALSELIEFKICIEQDMLKAFGSRTRLAAMSVSYAEEEAAEANGYVAQWLYDKLQRESTQGFTVNGHDIRAQDGSVDMVLRAVQADLPVAVTKSDSNNF
jgi:hypothetical protein